MKPFITRAYNNFEVDQSNSCVLIKKSSEKRLLDEINYYENLPKTLLPFFPRVFSSIKKDENYEMSLEYYAYQNVGEKMFDSNFDSEFWNKFFNVLSQYFSIYQIATKNDPSESDAKMMYVDKTERENKSLLDNFPFFTELSQSHEIVLNGKTLKNFHIIWPKIKDKILKNYLSDPTYLIHGDFCFSNILFGQNDRTKDVIVKFIDPRGSFGNSSFGDLYYDLAKISHSCSGAYEYFINDLFKIESDQNNFTLEITNDRRDPINQQFISFLKHNNYDYQKVKVLEGTIFIGMCARHYDSFERQKAMYLTGLKILNEVYENL